MSRTELDENSNLPRFNMPLELGLFLGARRFGNKRQQAKACLVLDRERFRYQAYMSDLAGQDIGCHDGKPEKVIPVVRDWLSHFAPDDVILPGGKMMVRRHQAFRQALPAMLDGAGIEPDELIYNDYTSFVVGWLRANPRGAP